MSIKYNKDKVPNNTTIHEFNHSSDKNKQYKVILSENNKILVCKLNNKIIWAHKDLIVKSKNKNKKKVNK